MDYVWTPWRYQYLKQVETGPRPECFFCDAVTRKDDHATLVVYRGKKVFIILNRYPLHLRPRHDRSLRARRRSRQRRSRSSRRNDATRASS